MHTRTDEIADGVYRISTFVDDVPPRGFTFNQFLVDAEEPPRYPRGPIAVGVNLLLLQLMVVQLHQLLLQIMEDGRLTDAQGRTVEYVEIGGPLGHNDGLFDSEE